MTNEQLAAYAAGAPCPHVDVMEMAQEVQQLRGNLSQVDAAYNRGFAEGSGNEGEYQREISQLKLHAAEAEREMLSQSEKRQLAQIEIDRLREVLTIPLITPDTTSSAFFIRVLSEHEKGLPVNTQDLINALMWRVRNQKREIARLHATIGGES